MHCHRIVNNSSSFGYNKKMSFKGRNDIDYSKSTFESETYFNGNRIDTREARFNSHSQPLKGVYIVFENKKMILKEVLQRTYYENGNIKTEKYIVQDFNKKQETTYYKQFSIDGQPGCNYEITKDL